MSVELVENQSLVQGSLAHACVTNQDHLGVHPVLSKSGDALDCESTDLTVDRVFW
jgi:hypothetical protein